MKEIKITLWLSQTKTTVLRCRTWDSSLISHRQLKSDMIKRQQMELVWPLASLWWEVNLINSNIHSSRCFTGSNSRCLTWWVSSNRVRIKHTTSNSSKLCLCSNLCILSSNSSSSPFRSVILQWLNSSLAMSSKLTLLLSTIPRSRKRSRRRRKRPRSCQNQPGTSMRHSEIPIEKPSSSKFTRSLPVSLDSQLHWLHISILVMIERNGCVTISGFTMYLSSSVWVSFAP